MKTTKEKMVEAVYKKLPYSTQISNLNLSLDGQIRFDWRGNSFRVGTDPVMVEEIKGPILRSSDLALLLETLIKQEFK